ncbi:MAG: SDR family NAD(P)-dependent oxidoreductase [Myxococcales bacterium]|nr:SDR family NAD(P)-dependent oxidoreductase [Myxococcales bacterium]
MGSDKRVAVVTGASRGLGLATATALAERGYAVVLTARSMDKAEAAAAPLRARGLDVTPEQVDVGSDGQVAGLFERLDRAFGRVDVLVNNAGSIFEPYGSKAVSLPSEVVAKTIDNNALSAYRTSQQALPRMNAAGYGRIVNVSSGMGGITEMNGGTPGYRLSKAALNATTRIFHAEAGSNVKVNAVCPGWVRTDMGGDMATRSVEDGAAGIIWAATLDDDGPSGGFFRDGKPTLW